MEATRARTSGDIPASACSMAVLAASSSDRSTVGRSLGLPDATANAAPFSSSSSHPSAAFCIATAVRSVTEMTTVRGHCRCTSTDATCGRSERRAVAARTSTRIIGVPSGIPATLTNCPGSMEVAPSTSTAETPMTPVQPAA